YPSAAHRSLTPSPTRRSSDLAAHPADDEARIDDRRTRDPALLDGLSQRGVGVVAVVAHVPDDRETGREHLDAVRRRLDRAQRRRDRKSTRLNSSHRTISYAVF